MTNTGSMKTYITLTNDSLAIFASSSAIVSMINMTAGGIRYIRLESDGHQRLYQDKGFIEGWEMLQDILKGQVDDCAYPTVCGEYGICINGQCSTCPIGSKDVYFKQIDPNMTKDAY
jgi:hypothetical protein